MSDLIAPGRPRESNAPVSAGDLLSLIRTGRAATRSQLRLATGLSRTAVTSRVSALTDAGLVLVGQEQASTGGRPPGSLVFNTEASVVLAVAIGRSRTQLAVVDLAGRELCASSEDHRAGTPPDELMPRVATRLAELLAEVSLPVVGVGLSLPGTIDQENGSTLDSLVLGDWDGVALAPYLREVTDAPLFCSNDADALARSERLGAAGRLSDVLVLKASTGLGLGIVAGGRVLTGHLGAAGEIGHTKVDVAAGLPCRCGATGCLETVAGGWALVARLAKLGRPVTHVRELVGLAAQGDAEARALLRESGRRLGEVLAVAVNLLNPQAVVVGGDMGAAFDLVASGLRESIYARAAPLATRDLQILPSAYGDRAGLVGSAAVALDRVLAPEAVDARLAALA